MRVEAVIFDIGNVLIRWQPELYFDEKIGEARSKALFDAVDLHGMMVRIDKGGVFAQVVEDTARDNPDWSEEILLFRDDWCGIAKPELPHSVRLLRALRNAGVPVFALSNFGAENFPMSKAQFPFLKEFDRRYISGEMRMVKPDAEIYEAVERDCGIPPGGLLFADDRQDNVEAAAARGWQTHLFTDPALFAEDLVGRGLLKKDDAQ